MAISGPAVATARRALVGHLTADRVDEACAVVAAAVAQGLGPVEAYVDLVGFAVEEALEADPLHDDVSLAVADRVVTFLHQRLEPPPRGTKGVVLVGGPPGERHPVEAAVVCEVLAMDGYDVRRVPAGADGWADRLAALEGEPALAAAVLALATPASVRRSATLLPVVRQALDRCEPRAVLALAGPGLEGGHPMARRLGADLWSPDARGLALLLDARLGTRTRQVLLSSVH